MPAGFDLLESGDEPIRWRRRWAALPRRWRRAAVVLAVAVLVGAGLLAARGWAADRALRQQVRIAASLEVEINPTSPPGGSVLYYVAVRNDGARPLTVTSVAAVTGRLRIRGDGEHRVDPGRAALIPLSVRLTCSAGDGGLPGLTAEVRLRREDGGPTTRRVDLARAGPVLDVAATLCAVRPGLRGYELSGPVVRAG
ncbi:hypothetical protein [Geodermatophilus sp. URMC 64]